MKIGIAGYGYVEVCYYEHYSKEYYDSLLVIQKGHYGDSILLMQSPFVLLLPKRNVVVLMLITFDVIDDAKKVDVPILIKSTIYPRMETYLKTHAVTRI